jgi:hypothetical protein
MVIEISFVPIYAGYADMGHADMGHADMGHADM